jgi:sugar/nucleoside kinase (ribokinase family)
VTNDLLRRSRHLHIASYFLQIALQPGLPDLFARAHTLGMTTSFDTNWDPSGEWRGFDELLCRVDVFLPNEYSARSLPRFSSARPCLAPFPKFYIILAEKVHLSFYPLFVSQALTRNNDLLLLLIYRKIHSMIHLIIMLKRMLC